MYSFIYNKQKIDFHYVNGDHISNSWKENTFYEILLLERIKSLNLNGLYVDVGSHHGNHSIFFDKFCNSEKVISIEGNPFNFDYLKMNINKNNCNNILYNVIVSDKKGENLTMKYNHLNTGMSSVINTVETTCNKNNSLIMNTTDTLDNLLENEENINLIKLDIENYEYFALLGAQKIIDKFHPVIVIELHETNPYYNDIKKFLSTNNYKTNGISYAASPTFIYTH